MPSHRRALAGTCLALPVACLALAAPARAQVVLDGTANPASSGPLPGPDYAIPAELGRTEGGNLFHSFARFGLRTGESATFSGPAGIDNVISRVTGGARSDIDGALRSTIPGADFFFLNPAGVVFGPNATLDVQGSFHVSTADELRFSDGATFSATDPGASSFTMAPPEAFGFLGAEPAGITVDESVLTVSPGEAISFVGGPLDVIGGPLGFIRAEAGRITLAALDGPGAAAVGDGDIAATAFTDIRLTDRAVVNASGDGGGAVRIRGGRFVVEDRSLVAANNFGSLPASGGVAVEAEAVTVGAGSALAANASGSGAGGGVFLDVGRLELRDGGQVTASTFGSGAGGGILVVAEEEVVAAGSGAGLQSGLFANSQGTGEGAGPGGGVFLDVGRLELTDGAQVAASTFGPGAGGGIAVVAEGEVVAAGAGAGFRSGLVATSEGAGPDAGAGGDVALDVGRLELRDGGGVVVTTFGAGRAGDLNVEAGEVVAAGRGEGFTSGLFATSEGGGTGAGGDVTLDVGRLELHGGAAVTASTFGPGAGGSLTVSAGEVVATGMEGEIASGLFASSASRDPGAGPGGGVFLDVGRLKLSEGAQVAAAALGPGNAGAVEVTVGGLLSIASGGIISSSTFGAGAAGGVSINARELTVSGEGSAVQSDTRSAAADGGAAGGVVVEAGRVTVADGGEIAADTLGGGRGGTVVVQAPAGTVRVAGGGRLSARALAGSTNDAGAVLVTADVLEVRGGGLVDSSTRGPGEAGGVIIDARRVFVDDAGFEGFTGIASDSEGDATGAAGVVAVTADEVTLTGGGVIRSNTFTPGAALGVAIDARRVTVSGEGSALQSDSRSAAVDGGAAGGVFVVTERAAVTDGGEIAADTLGGGAGGVVVVQAPAGSVTVAGGRLSTRALMGSSGAAGGVLVTADTLEVREGGFVDSSTRGAGEAGGVFVEARRVFVDGTGADAFTGISASSESGATRDAGAVEVTGADEVVVRGGGAIRSSTFTTGNAGGVFVEAADLTVTGPGSGLLADSLSMAPDGGAAGGVAVEAGRVTVADGAEIASETFGGGRGGAIEVRARNATITGGGEISTASFGESADAGRAGGIVVEARETLRMSGDAAISAETARADAGDVVIRVGRLVDVEDSAVTTSVADGEGGGGNIFIDPDFVILDDGDVVARARQGAGGNIDIVAGHLFRTPDSDIDASSDLGIDGQVSVDAPDVDVTSGLVALPAAFVDASSLLRESCAAGRAEMASTFIGVGRGGVAPGPEAPLAGSYAGLVDARTGTAADAGEAPRFEPVGLAVACGDSER